jgi:threonine dehydrogenase-like Zn-dependent dehydrogenase
MKAFFVWAALGAGLALSAVLLFASWHALFPPTMRERYASRADCQSSGTCAIETLAEVAGVVLGGAGLVGLGMVAIRRAMGAKG